MSFVRTESISLSLPFRLSQFVTIFIFGNDSCLSPKGMSINIVEVTWKGNLKRAFPDPNAYSAFMGNFSTATGSVTLVMMILGRFIFQKFGWTAAALVTPTVLALTGAFFFSLILFEGPFAPLLSYFGTTPLMAAVLIGAAQVRFFILLRSPEVRVYRGLALCRAVPCRAVVGLFFVFVWAEKIRQVFERD